MFKTINEDIEREKKKKENKKKEDMIMYVLAGLTYVSRSTAVPNLNHNQRLLTHYVNRGLYPDIFNLRSYLYT